MDNRLTLVLYGRLQRGTVYVQMCHHKPRNVNTSISIPNHILIKLPYIYSYRKACNFFSKLHSFCSLRDVRNCTLSKRPRHALPNQVKLHPSNKCPCLGYASFTMARVENGCCASAHVVYY